MSSNFEDFFQNAVQPGPQRLTAGFCFAAINRDGTKRVSKAFGTTSVAGNTPFPEDPFIWIASMTKLVTGIAVLQYLEKGVFSLDDAELIQANLPELARLQVISSFSADEPEVVLEPRATPITLRMLLTHTNGTGYDAVQPGLLAWRASRGESSKWIGGNLLESYETPLVAQPGTAFNYSPGYDWAGLLIQRTTGISLGEYFTENIFRPLGLSDTLFDETARPDLQARLIPPTRRADMTGQLEDGALPDHAKSHSDDEYGGAGLYSTASDFLSLLSAVLREDPRILKPESYTLLRSGNLEQSVKDSLNTFVAIPFVRNAFAPGIPDGHTFNFGMGTLVTQSDIPGIAKKGSFGWTGVCNQFWWVDPATGYCAVFLQNLHPAGDMNSDGLRRKVREYLWQEFDGS